MARSTKAATIRRKLEATPYDGSNEFLNRILDDETVFVVQGSFGRVPIIADTAEEAKDAYVEKYAVEIKREEEDSFE